jgi:hypothetical protein
VTATRTFFAALALLTSTVAAFAAKPTVSTKTLPDGTVGTTYTQTVTATGGTAPLTWSINSGSLPAGLTLNSNGTITGTPTTAGTFKFVVKVVDAENLSDTQSLQIVINPAPAPPTITTTSLPGGTVATPYPQQTLRASGGTAPYTWSISAGSLPAGLTLSSTGIISGTPTTAGTSSFTAQVMDAANLSATQPLQIVISAAATPPTITTTSLPGGTAGTAYPQQTLGVSGGTAPYTWTISAGSLPAGLTLSSTGTITGTPTTAGTSSFTVKVTDSANLSSTQPLQIVISPAPTPPTITTTSLPGGTAGTVYPQQTLGASGGTTPYTWSISAGSLPAGLTLSSTGTITGTPTTAGTSNFTAKVTDSANLSASQPLQIVIGTAAAPPTITTTALPGGTAGTVYPQQTLGASGGTAPYTWSITAGSLPAGLTMSTGGVITGTPTTAGTSNFTVQVTDAANLSSTQQLQIVISTAATPPTVTTTSLPSGTAGTSYPQQTLGVTGGTGPYTWSVSAGALPAGLTLATSGALTGTPTTAGTYNFTAKVTDSANLSGTQPLQIVINAAATPPTVTTTSLPSATAGTSYPQVTLNATGGTAPYTWSISAGALPGGLTLSSSGAITGTPTTAGTFDFTVKATDAANLSGTQPLQIVVNPAAAPPTITTTSLPGGTAGTKYGPQNLGVSGGTPPYTWSISAGSLPTGLTLASNGTISGTPTTAGTSSFTVKVTDAANLSGTQPLQIVIAAASVPTITATALSSGTVGAAYAPQNLTVTGGTAPYTWSISAGSLPAGLTLGGNGTVTGTPTAAGTFTFTAKVTDASSLTDTRSFQIVINAAATPPVITSTSLPAGTAGTAYQQSLTATGGTPPFTWAVSAGLLPSGLTLAPSGVIAGTPTTSGTFSFAVKVTDSANLSDTNGVQIVINPAAPPPTVVSDVLPRGISGAPYSAPLTASGGVGAYTWSIASGALPAGVTLDAASGQLQGTPSVAGTFSFLVRVTDSRGGSSTKNLNIIVAQPLAITACPASTAQVGIPYASNFTSAGGTQPYTWSASGQLPPGLAVDSSAGRLAGTPVAAGTFTFSVQLTDAASQSTSRSCSVSVSPVFSIVTDTLPDATMRATYSQTLSVVGGTGPYRWDLTSGSLPPGLGLDSSSGNVSGVPSQVGTFSFTITATDSHGAQAQRAYRIAVGAGLTIAACPANSASIGAPYTATLEAVGGVLPVRWTISSGSLPAGLGLATDTGVISGSPTATGASTFTLQVADASGAATTRACSMTISGQLSIGTASFANGSVGSPYSENATAIGGTAPYTWTLSDGTLPSGLTLNSATGSISGLPVQTGSSSFTLHVVDAGGIAADKAFTIVIGSGFTISACPRPSATVGLLYSSGASTSGGESSLTWTLVNGTLPAGLNLAAGTGTITGTASQPGTSDFSLKATGASASATRACTITVSVAALGIASPPNLPNAVLGVSYDQKLSTAGGKGPYTWSVIDGTLPQGITMAPDGSLKGAPTTAGTYTFTARLNDSDSSSVAQVFVLTVLPGPAPVVQFSNLPDIIGPAQQPNFNLTLNTGYPVALTGKLVMKFTPDPGIGVDDRSIRFVTGTRTMDFDIPANSTQPVFTVPQPALQTGTVAGTIEITVQLLAGDVDVTPNPVPTKTIRIDRTAPVITSVQVTTVPGGFQIAVTGYSTTREVLNATFQFTTAAGSRLDNNQVQVNTTDAARQWFSDARSANFGGQFTLVQPFTVQGVTLTDVNVTLTNGQGTSSPVHAKF